MTYPIVHRAYIRMRDTSTRAAIDHTMESARADRNPCTVNPVTCTFRSLEFTFVKRYVDPITRSKVS